MFFRKLKSQINDLVDKTKRLDERLDFVQHSKLNDLTNEIGKIERILRYHSHGEVVGHVDIHTGNFLCGTNLYVYKDGEEYSLPDVFVENPIFTQGEAENLVYVESGDRKEKYLLDLKNQTSVLIKKEENES